MDADALRSILERSPWFTGIDPALQQRIVELGRVRRFSDQLIYAMGDDPNGFFALLSGEVRITQVAGSGRTALLMLGRPGAWFGESSMLDGKQRFSYARAVGEAIVLQLSPADFATLTREHPDAYAAFAAILFERHRQAVDHIIESADVPLDVRLARRLLELVDSRGTAAAGGPEGEIRLSQEDLAGTLGVSRQTLNKALKALEKRGLVKAGYARLRVVAPEGLRRLASGEAGSRQ